MRGTVVLACLVLLSPAARWAQAQDPAAARLQALEERIRALEAEVQSLKAGQAGARPAAEPPPAPAPPAAPATVAVDGTTLPVYGGRAAWTKVFNPDITVTGNFLGAIGRNDVRPVPVLEMHETEVGYQAIVDPYARADFFLSFTPEGVELEEGYLTFTSLPAGLVAKVGKMRASFGKVNTLHSHSLPWIDRPLVTDNLLAGEEGISDAGISLSRILPAPKGLFLEATGQVFQGNSGDVFAATRRRDVAFVGHLRAYRDLTESTNLDLGFSYGRGHNDAGAESLTQLYGANATLRWRPLRRAIYQAILARAEFVWSRREQAPLAQQAFGFYTAGEYRLNRRWTLGARYDRSGRARDAGLTDSGFSALLTYWPSEFSQVRGQYRFARYAEGRDANELRFQFLFTLGAHAAHPF